MTTDKISRRTLGGLAAAGVGVPLLAACGSDPDAAADPGGSSSSTSAGSTSAGSTGSTPSDATSSAAGGGDALTRPPTSPWAGARSSPTRRSWSPSRPRASSSASRRSARIRAASSPASPTAPSTVTATAASSRWRTAMSRRVRRRSRSTRSDHGLRRLDQPGLSPRRRDRHDVAGDRRALASSVPRSPRPLDHGVFLRRTRDVCGVRRPASSPRHTRREGRVAAECGSTARWLRSERQPSATTYGRCRSRCGLVRPTSRS